MDYRSLLAPALAACALPLHAQAAYEPAPQGAIPPDTLIYIPSPEEVDLDIQPLPDGERLAVPAKWEYASQYTLTEPSRDPWWQSFRDPVLTALISQAETTSFSLREAWQRIQIASRTEQIAKAGYYPTLAAQAGYTLERAGGAQTSTLVKNPRLNYMSLGLSAQWEIDLFGRVQANVKQAKVSQLLARADYDAALVSLTAQLAKAYVQLRLYQAELLVAKDHLGSQQRIVDMTISRHEAGLAPKLDVVQAQMVLTSTQATIPPLEAMIGMQINSIATLAGLPADSVAPLLSTPREMPDPFQRPLVGTPLDVIRRRPDIAQAEATLAADAASIGIAKKDFLPTLSLTGSFGVAAHKPGDLFKNQAISYSVAPTLSWTIFDGLARNYRLASAREQMQADIDAYNLTLLTAIQEVDNATLSYEGYLKSLLSYRRLVNESREALDLSVSLYRSTLASFTNVVDAQMSLLEYENSRLQARAQALTSLIGLYEALGGAPANQ